MEWSLMANVSCLLKACGKDDKVGVTTQNYTSIIKMHARRGDSANDTPLVIEIAIYLLSSFLITSNYQLTTKGSQGSLPARRWHVQLQDHFPLRNAPLSTGLTTTTCNLQHVLSI